MNKNAMKRIIIMMNVILVFLAACGRDTTDDNVVEQIEFTPNQSAYITQYSDDTGLQSMFYTIETPTNELIVIDGGNPENAGQVRRVIQEKGNHVSAWILTHPHSDHIGAFNEIWPQLGDIQVDCVYAIDMNYENYKALAQPWDGFEYFEKFLEIVNDDSRLTYLYTGDEWECGGLKFQMLSAYDSEITDTLTTDLCNDGSMIFKVTNQEESMLFCSDVGVRMSNEVLNNYKDLLPSDYIQMGHHGNGGLSEEFYMAVSPKVAFFDAPEWLMNPSENTNGWTTPKNRELMERLGSQIYYYATAPNSIELK